MKKVEKEIEKKIEKKIKDKIEEKCDCSCDCNSEETHKHYHHKCHTGNGCIYGLGLIGSAVFFISQAGNFWQGVLGFLKALIWPAMMAYELFKFLIK